MIQHLTRTMLSVGLMAGLAVAGATLDVQPDAPAAAGDAISITISDANPGDVAFLFVGDPGTTDLGKFTLDIEPFLVLPLGVADADGTVSIGATVPDSLPPEVSGLTLTLQAVTVGFEIGGGGPPTTSFCVTNTDTLSFE